MTICSNFRDEEVGNCGDVKLKFFVQNVPVGNGESQWILKTETITTLSSLVKVIKEPWEAQFGVELQKNLYPSVMVRPWRNIL